MMKQALSIVMLLLVALAFGGVASAATQKVLVSDAYDETVLVSPAYDEQVLVTPAWNETIPAETHEEQQLVSEAYMEQVFDHYLVNGAYTVFHPAVYETVHHDAVYETIVVVDIPAFDEQILVTPEIPAYDELISAEIPAFDEQIGQKSFDRESDANKYGKDKVKYGFADSFTVTRAYEYCHTVYVTKLFKHHDAVPAVYKHHDAIPAVYETVHHDAVTHEEQVLVAEAYDEEVLVSEAYNEQVPYSGNGPYFGTFPDWNDINAWSNWIYSHPGATGGYGSWNAFYVSTFHPAVYETVVVVDVPEQVVEHAAVFETVHHEAVYEVIHHPAVYEDVEVADPVAPVAPNEVPLKELPTGGSAVAIAFAALLVLIGGGILARMMK